MNTILQKNTITEAVVNHFINEIRTGRLKSGDKLPSERVLQKELNISRFSLREGLAKLSALGLIRIVQGKGAFVASEINKSSLGHVLLPLLSDPKDSSLNELIDARVLIEERVATLAAKRRTIEDIDALRGILEQADHLLNDSIAFGDLDYRFHMLIAQTAGNIFFQKMLDVINSHIHSFLRCHAEDYDSRKNALKSHWLIFECIATGDDKNVGAIMQSHINNCMNNYKKHILNKHIKE